MNSSEDWRCAYQQNIRLLPENVLFLFFVVVDRNVEKPLEKVKKCGKQIKLCPPYCLRCHVSMWMKPTDKCRGGKVPGRVATRVDVFLSRLCPLTQNKT